MFQRMIVEAGKTAVNWLRGQSDFAHTCMAGTAAGAASALVPNLQPHTAAAVNLASMGVMLGTQCWVGFVAGPTMFTNMDRHAFGDIQARLFPKMGMVNMAMSALALTSYLCHKSPDTCSSLIGSSLFINTLSSFVLFPVTAHYQYEMRKHEVGTPERKKAGMMFGINHGTAVLLTYGSIMANLAYLYIVAAKIW